MRNKQLHKKKATSRSVMVFPIFIVIFLICSCAPVEQRTGEAIANLGKALYPTKSGDNRTGSADSDKPSWLGIDSSHERARLDSTVEEPGVAQPGVAQTGGPQTGAWKVVDTPWGGAEEGLNPERVETRGWIGSGAEQSAGRDEQAEIVSGSPHPASGSTGVSKIERSAEMVLENASSVLKSGSQKLLVEPKGDAETGQSAVERSAAQALENAASVVRSGSQVIWPDAQVK